jgi:hypothetical protein
MASFCEYLYLSPIYVRKYYHSFHLFAFFFLTSIEKKERKKERKKQQLIIGQDGRRLSFLSHPHSLATDHFVVDGEKRVEYDCE